MNTRQHLWALRHAATQAGIKCLVMLIIRRPECAQRAAWVVEFDRQMDLARRAMLAVR